MTSFYITNKSNSYPVAIFVFLGWEKIGAQVEARGVSWEGTKEKNDKSFNKWTDDKNWRQFVEISLKIYSQILLLALKEKVNYKSLHTTITSNLAILPFNSMEISFIRRKKKRIFFNAFQYA